MSTHSARRITLLFLVLLTAALFAAACGGDDDSSGDGGSRDSGGSSSSTANEDGDCGATEDDGLKIVRHCGDASGSILAEGDSVDFEDGSCENTGDSVVVNLGTSVVDPTASSEDQAKYQYLGILAGKHPAAEDSAPAVDKDGTFTEGVLMSAVVGDGRTLGTTDVELELEDGRTKGTFSAKDESGAIATGTFDCG